jgi:hypothetical protein
MKILALALAGALSLAAAAPALAQPYGPPRHERLEHRHDRGERWEHRHHRGHRVRVCHTVWRHHHPVRVCRVEARRW